MDKKELGNSSRRDFITKSVIASAGAVLGGSMLTSFTAEKKQGTDDINTATIGVGKRKLGKLEVSAIGLGVQNMSRTYQTTIPNRKEMHNIIRTAFDNGVTFFDAAEAYGPWEVEKILGEGVAPFRDKIVIATKFGWNIDQETGKRLQGLNSQPQHIKKVVEGMLKRLNTDRIDLLYQHRVDPQVPIEDVVGGIKDLIKEGKVLHYGLSEPGHQTVRRAHKEHPVTAIQNEHSLIWRGSENKIIPLCEELGIGFVPWSPLGMAFLTGAIDENTSFAQGDFRSLTSRVSPENLPKNMPLVNLLKKWSIEKETTPAQISLAWLLHQKPWIVPIPGTTQMAHMLENAGADKVKFTASEYQELNNQLAGIKIIGERLPQGVLAFSDVEAPEKNN